MTTHFTPTAPPGTTGKPPDHPYHLFREEPDATLPVTPEDVSELERRLAAMAEELEARTSAWAARQKALDVLQRAVDRERDEADELAFAIGRGQDLLAKMRVRATLDLPRPLRLTLDDIEAVAAEAA